jgi:hypothetical protein
MTRLGETRDRLARQSEVKEFVAMLRLCDAEVRFNKFDQLTRVGDAVAQEYDPVYSDQRLVVGGMQVTGEEQP